MLHICHYKNWAWQYACHSNFLIPPYICHFLQYEDVYCDIVYVRMKVPYTNNFLIQLINFLRSLIFWPKFDKFMGRTGNVSLAVQIFLEMAQIRTVD
jgi:hypothetical protein